MSISIICFIIYTIFFFCQELVLRTQPNLIVTNYIDADPLRVEWNSSSNFMMALALQHPGNYAEFLNGSIYYLGVKQQSIIRTDNGTVEQDTRLVFENAQELLLVSYHIISAT
jgi:hypothetical protein